jgi:hypothetical protein
MQADAQLYVAPDAPSQALIAVLLTKLQEATAFAEAVRNADITFVDTDMIADHLASLDVAQFKLWGPQ